MRKFTPASPRGALANNGIGGIKEKQIWLHSIKINHNHFEIYISARECVKELIRGKVNFTFRSFKSLKITFKSIRKRHTLVLYANVEECQRRKTNCFYCVPIVWLCVCEKSLMKVLFHQQRWKKTSAPFCGSLS